MELKERYEVERALLIMQMYVSLISEKASQESSHAQQISRNLSAEMCTHIEAQHEKSVAGYEHKFQEILVATDPNKNGITGALKSLPSIGIGGTAITQFGLSTIIDEVSNTLEMPGIELDRRGMVNVFTMLNSYQASVAHVIREVLSNYSEALQNGVIHISADYNERDHFSLGTLYFKIDRKPTEQESEAINHNLQHFYHGPFPGKTTKEKTGPIGRGYGLMLAQQLMRSVGGDIKYTPDGTTEIQIPSLAQTKAVATHEPSK